MYSTLVAVMGLLALTAPVMSVPTVQAVELESRKSKNDDNGCGITLIIGKTLKDGPTQCSASTWIGDPSDFNNWTTIWNNTHCNDYNKATTLLSSTDTNKFSNSSIGSFSISMSGNTCSDEGENCNPLLKVGGSTTEMNHESKCKGYHTSPYGGEAYAWNCQAPCGKIPAGPKCSAPKKGPSYKENGTAKRVSDTSDCSGAESCSITAAKANAVANSLTNTKETTVTNTEGVTVTFTYGMEFLGTGSSGSVAVQQQYSKAISQSSGITKTNTLTTTTSYTFTQKANTDGYLEWIPELSCQNMTMTCDGHEFHMKACQQVQLAGGNSPSGIYILKSVR